MVYTRRAMNTIRNSPEAGHDRSLIIGPLVDIVLAPAGNNFGRLCSVDSSGNLL